MLRFIFNLLFPPECLICKVRVTAHGTLCLSCWQSVRFITEPMCGCCGLPFDYEMGNAATGGNSNLCAECLHTRPLYGRARAAFCYDENSRRLITRFKYSDQTQLAKIYGQWLTRAGGELLAQTDIIVPVPLHYFRFVARRFNQSSLLAWEISKNTGIKHLPCAIKRTRHTKQQTGLSKSQRAVNVKNAFSIRPRYAAQIKGRNILLVDDVITTGSTIKQCVKALLKAGATQVNVLTLARAGR